LGDCRGVKMIVVSLFFLSVLLTAFSTPSRQVATGSFSRETSLRLVSLQDLTPPVWPTGSKVVATQITSSSIYINWTLASDDSGTVNYKVYVNGGWDGMLHLANSFGMSYLPPNSTYTFQVVAVDPSGNQATGPSGTFTTAPQICTGYLACLVFKPAYYGTPFPGGIVTFVGFFTNSGQTPIMVLEIYLTGDLGSYSVQGPDLAIGQVLNRNISIILPANESVGSHLVRISVSWDYLYPVDGSWRPGSNIDSNSTLTVVNRPSTPPGTTNPLVNPSWLTGLLGILGGYWPFVVGSYVILASAGSIAVIRRDRRRRDALRQAF
jgi:fibronectin type III domain protein